jgi:hypothetical protein
MESVQGGDATNSEAEMSVEALAYPRAAGREMGGTRLAASSGIASALAFLVGTAVLNVPIKASDRELVQWWSSDSHQTEALLSMIGFTLSGLLFLLFLAQLRTRLLAAEGGAGTLTTVVFSAGLLLVGTLFVAATVRGVVSHAVKSPAGEQPLPGVDLLRYLPQLSYVVLGFCGMLAAALAMAVTSVLAFRTRVFGRVVAWIGVVAALVSVAANGLLVGNIAIPALLLWMVATSVAFWRGDATRG